MPEWDDIYRKEGKVFTQPHPDMERVVKLFREHDVQRVLDLGCGAGRHIIHLAQLGFEMYGFDSSPAALKIAREWLDDTGLDAVLVDHRMEHSFPYDDGFFDGILSIQVIHHNMMNDIMVTTKEIARVLRSGGVLFLSVTASLCYGPVQEGRDWYLVRVEEGTYVPQKGPESGIPHHYFTVDELKRLLHDFDILDIYIDETSHRCVVGIKK